jgi:molybdenum cofactor cytidylyltransferase
MGRNKLLLEIAGESLLRQAVSAALGAGLEPVIVVLGHEASRAAAEIADLDCRPIVNRDYRDGIGTSLRAGVAALPPGVDAALSLLADMPHVDSDMLRRLADVWRERHPPLVLSDYAGVTAPPFLYDRRLFAQLDELPDHCDRRVIKRNRENAVVVRWPAEALDDVDEPRDLAAARDRRAAISRPTSPPQSPD